MGGDTQDLGGGSNWSGGKQGAGGDEEHFRLDVPAERERESPVEVNDHHRSKVKGQSQLTAHYDIAGAEQLKMFQ